MTPHPRPFAKPAAAPPRFALTAPVVVLVIAAVAIGSAALFLNAEKRIAGEWGYPLDDSWIYATMARNLATGHGFAFNPDEPIAGATGPLYTFILALFYLIFREVVWSAKIFGIACHIGAGVAFYYTAIALLPGKRLLSLLAAILVITSPPLLWGMLSGMEIPLYLLLVGIGLALYVRSRHLLATLVWSVGVWARPDGLLLVALSLLGPPKEAARRLAVAAPVLLAFFGFNHWIGGHWMPQTVGAKAHLGFDLVGRTWNMMREWGALWGIPYRHTDEVEEPLVLLALLLLGAVLTVRRRPLFALYAIGYPLVLSLFREHSGSHKRYMLYVIPFGMLLAIQAIDYLGQRFGGRRATAAATAAAAACLLWQGFYIPQKAETYAWNVQNINKMQCLLGNFVKLVTQPGDVVAVNDIGAIGYFGERYVVDLMGLISPPRTLPENLTRYRPKLLIIFLTWFEPYARQDPKSGNYMFFDSDSTHRYELIAGIELGRNTICANDRMTAYLRLGPNEPSPNRRWLYKF